MHELPLVFFTVFAQTAAGMIFVAALTNLFTSSRNVAVYRISLCALLFMVVGMALASLHLGRPFRALNVLAGVGRSPMSNEILLFGGFFVLSALFVLLEKYQALSAALRQILLVLAAIAGILLVWLISVVYSMETVVTWSTHYTFIQMICTMLIAGGFIAAALGSINLGILVAVIGAVISFTIEPGYISYITRLQPQLVDGQGVFWLLHNLLIILALAMLILNRLRCSANGVCCPHIYKVCAVLVVVAELIGRIAFYNLWMINM